MRKVSIFGTLLILIVFVFIGLSPHRLRSALIPTKEISSTQLFNTVDGLTYYFEDQEIIGQYDSLIPDSFQFQNEEQIIDLFSWFASTYYPPRRELKYYSRLSAEYPQLLINQYKSRVSRGSCFNDAILFGFFLQVKGFKVRQVGFLNEDGHGNSGHSMLEVWLDSKKKWAFIDAQNAVVFFEKGTDELLSVLEIRNRALTQDSSDFYNKLSIIQFNGFSLGKEKLYRFYKKNCDELVVSAFSNPVTASQENWIYETSFWISSQKSKSFERLSRFFRATFDKSRVNYRYVDDYSPQVNYNVWYTLANVLFFGLFVFVFLFFYSKIKGK